MPNGGGVEGQLSYLLGTQEQLTEKIGTYLCSLAAASNKKGPARKYKLAIWVVLIEDLKLLCIDTQ